MLNISKIMKFASNSKLEKSIGLVEESADINHE